MSLLKNMLKYLVISFLLLNFQAGFASGNESKDTDNKIKVGESIMEHVADSYEWHITTIGEKHVSFPLPVIVRSRESGWHVFLSSKFHHGHSGHKNFYIAQEGDYKGKIVEKDFSGKEIRPLDISITKNSFALLFNSSLLVCIILLVARWYRKKNQNENYKAPKGFIAFMELFIMNINDDLIKPCIGKDYKKFAPYLLTVFFFIFINNLIGLVPFFPGGANLTGNITITLVLALLTFFIVNIFGTKEYWKEIFWPEVPVLLKAPIPIMPVIEIVGLFTKPFALMIRLFANILAGHSMLLGLAFVIFITTKVSPSGTELNVPMTIVSILLSVFISFVELLVAYIQAYVFTLLSAVFIGLARVEAHHNPS